VIRFREDVVNGTGRRVRVCRKQHVGKCSDMTRAMAQRAADELLSKGANNPTFQPTTTITFSEFVDTKLRPGAFGTRKAGGLVTAESILRHHLIPWFGEMPLAAIKGEAVQRMVSSLIERGLGIASIRLIVGTLSGVFTWAKRWEYPVAFNRGDLILPKARKSKKVKHFTLEETLLIIEAAGPFYGLIFLTQCALCLRPGEVMALRVKDFNFASGAVLVESNSGAAYGPETLTTVKGNNPELKRLAPVVGAKIQEYLRTTWKPNKLGLLFPGERGGKIIALNFLRCDILYPILERLKLPREGRSLHALRHTAASVMGQAGASPSVVGSALRHQDGGALAAEVYTHVLGSDEVDAMDKLGTAVCGSPRKPEDGQLSFDFAGDSRKPVQSELRPDVSGSFASCSLA
jgi:integrase